MGERIIPPTEPPEFSSWARSVTETWRVGDVHVVMASDEHREHREPGVRRVWFSTRMVLPPSDGGGTAVKQVSVHETVIDIYRSTCGGWAGGGYLPRTDPWALCEVIASGLPAKWAREDEAAELDWLRGAE